LLSRGHVSSMTGGRTCPIYYQRVAQACFKHDFGEESKVAVPQPCFKHDFGGESKVTLPEPCFKHDFGGSRTLLSRRHVSSMTGERTCPIYDRGVVSVEKGSMIIRYKLAELIKKFSGREPLSGKPCFKHDRRMYMSDVQLRTSKLDNFGSRSR